MKLTRVILLALAFAIPFASTTLASAAGEEAGDTRRLKKPAKKKGARRPRRVKTRKRAKTPRSNSHHALEERNPGWSQLFAKSPRDRIPGVFHFWESQRAQRPEVNVLVG
jgi:hypothetical protein